jgi:hypothetical protein
MAHPFYTTISTLAQLLKYASRTAFDGIVRQLDAERYVKGFSCWSHFVSMLYAQLAGTASLRDIENALKSIRGEGNHLGFNHGPTKSNLAYANAHRTVELFKAFFYDTYNRIEAATKGLPSKFKFKNPFYSIDSTTIKLALSLFDWAVFKSRQGALKLHVMLNHQRNFLPCWAYISNAKMADVRALKLVEQTMFFEKGAIVCMDRGYIDYNIFYEWTKRNVYFVTRAKDNVSLMIVKDCEVPAPVGRPSASGVIDESKSRVIKDQIVRFSGKTSFEKCPVDLRLVTYWDAENNRKFTFMTNNFKLAASTIADIYKSRWAIESFFKTIKQYLKVKSFLGTSYNAVSIQIWTALTALLLAKYLQFLSKTGWGLSNVLNLVRLHLANHVDILKLLQWLAESSTKDKKPPPGQRQPVVLPGLF